MVRILTCAYVLVWLTGALGGLLGLLGADSARWQPVGVLAVLDGPPPAAAVVLVIAVVYASALAFAMGARPHTSGPALAVSFLLVATFRSSWGQIFHTDDLVAIHLVVLAVAPAAEAWAWDTRRRPAPVLPEARYGFPLQLMSLVTVLTYVLAGVAKLRTSGF